MAEDLGERTEDATPKRRFDAREQGQVARSQDLTGAVLLAAGTIALAAASVTMLGRGTSILHALLDGATLSDPLDPQAAWDAAVRVGAAGVRIAMPVLLVAWLTAFVAPLAQIGWMISPRVLQPKFSKLNPINGFKRVFGLSSFVKAGLDSLKLIVVISIAIVTIHEHDEEIIVMPYLSVLECLQVSGRIMFDLALRLLVVLLLLGIVDFTYQKWKHSQDLRMTKQQVKDEMKQSEGDPMVKRRRMRMQQQIAMQRISSAVPQADVVVTNPEHYAVAIRYDPDAMYAPRVVAKGADFLALRIRQIAMRHDIPIVERKPLARALFREVAVGQEIPPAHYAAVAEVLAFVYRMGGRQAG